MHYFPESDYPTSPPRLAGTVLIDPEGAGLPARQSGAATNSTPRGPSRNACSSTSTYRASTPSTYRRYKVYAVHSGDPNPANRLTTVPTQY
jgi:hypothetical protein